MACTYVPCHFYSFGFIWFLFLFSSCLFCIPLLGHFCFISVSMLILSLTVLFSWPVFSFVYLVLFSFVLLDFFCFISVFLPVLFHCCFSSCFVYVSLPAFHNFSLSSFFLFFRFILCDIFFFLFCFIDRFSVLFPFLFCLIYLSLFSFYFLVLVYFSGFVYASFSLLFNLCFASVSFQFDFRPWFVSVLLSSISILFRFSLCLPFFPLYVSPSFFLVAIQFSFLCLLVLLISLPNLPLQLCLSLCRSVMEKF